jgi:hypothetical protein
VSLVYAVEVTQREDGRGESRSYPIGVAEEEHGLGAAGASPAVSVAERLQLRSSLLGFLGVWMVADELL